MKTSESIAKLAAALCKAQGACLTALKDTTGQVGQQKYKYADLGAVWDACREPLKANGLSVVQMPAGTDEGNVNLETILLHESGEFIASTASCPLVKRDAQGVGSALTYLRRYSLAAALGIVADVDDDGAANTLPHGVTRGSDIPRPPARTNGNTRALPAPVAIQKVGQTTLLVPFGKNKGKNFFQLTDNQRSWYFDEWLKSKEAAFAAGERVHPNDLEFIEALQALVKGTYEPAADLHEDDIPWDARVDSQLN